MSRNVSNDKVNETFLRLGKLFFKLFSGKALGSPL